MSNTDMGDIGLHTRTRVTQDGCFITSGYDVHVARCADAMDCIIPIKYALTSIEAMAIAQDIANWGLLRPEWVATYATPMSNREGQIWQR